MKLLDFYKRFPDEDSCRIHWKEEREKQGIICPVCGGINHKWNAKQENWVCKGCYYRTSLRKSTVMENSNLPFMDWYIAMHLLTSTKQSFSAKELQRELNRKRYEPVWAMLHKLRHAMGKRDENYELEGFIEFDDAFFTTIKHETKEEKQQQTESDQEKQKRGKGSQRKSKVLVMTESESATKEEQEKGNYSKSRKLGYIKMILVENLKKETINEEAEDNINETSTVRTDGSNSFNDLKTKVSEHEFEILKTSDDVNRYLPWVHTVISNAKRLLLGVHYLIGKGYLQEYLNEFCYTLNRRYFGEKIFDRLIIAGISSGYTGLKEIRYEYLQDCG